MTVSLSVRDGVGFIRIDNPPVNGLSLEVRRELLAAFGRAEVRADVRAMVLHGAGRGFSAGGDIREFGTPAATADPGLSLHVHPIIEAFTKPVVAALHGFAIGGGLETALACHYRVAEETTKLGLPEGRLGLIPLSGTQRLPRAIGLKRALDVMLSGETYRAADFAGTALFDKITAQGEGLDAAADLALSVTARPLVRDLAPPRDGAADILQAARDLAPGQGALIDAIAAGIEADDFEAGLGQARAIYDALVAATEMAEARNAFFAREAP
jgi:enoyl-CoA hydratase